MNFRLLLLNILLLSTFIFAQDRKVYVDSLFSWDGDGNTLSDYNYGIQTKDIADSSVTSAKIAGFKVADTTALKALTGKADGDVVYMEEISSGAGVGSGDFVYKSSGYTADGGSVFDAPSGYWVRKDRIEKKRAVPQWFGNAGDKTDDQPYLQKCLDLTGDVYFPKPSDGRYVIGSKLRIKSNTRLTIEEGTEIYLKNSANDFVLENYNFYGSTTDSNITIIGGKWNGNASNQTGATTYPNWTGMGLHMSNVYNVTLKDTYWTNIVRFAGIFYESKKIRLYNTGIYNNKDGIDFIVCEDVKIRDSYGMTTDDFHGFFSGAYAAYKQVQGDNKHIDIDGIRIIDQDTTDAIVRQAPAVAMMGGANADGSGSKFEDVKIRNITGDEFTNYVVRVITAPIGGSYWPDSNYTYAKDFVIEDIKTKSYTYNSIRFEPSWAENVTIRNITAIDSGLYTRGISLGDTTTTSVYKNINIENIHAPFALQSDLITFEDVTDFYDVNITNITGNRGGNNHFVVSATGTASFNGYFNLTNAHTDSMGLIAVGANTTWNCPLNISNYSIKNVASAAPIQLKSNMTANLSNAFYNNVTYTYSANEAGKTTRVIGNGCTWVNALPRALISSSVASQNNPDMPADADNLTPQIGDEIWSFNSSNIKDSVTVRYGNDNRWHTTKTKSVVYTFSGIDPPSLGASGSGTAKWDTLLTIPTGVRWQYDDVQVVPDYSLSTWLGYDYRIDSATSTRVKLIIYNHYNAAYNQAAMNNWRIIVRYNP